jgi:hypothetical protein
MAVTARQNATQEIHYIRANVAFNSVASGTSVSLGAALPAGAVVLFTSVGIQTVFNAGTTNVLIVGTGSDDDALVAAGGADETAVGVTNVVPATLGGIMSASADTELFWKYTQSGTAATTGAATIVVAYVPNA